MSSFNREKIKEILMPIVMQAYETKDSNLDIRKNTLDIFSASIDSAIRGISLQEWESQERQRQIQKTLQNQIGELHQKVLGTLEGVSDLGVSQVVDLEGSGFIAEVKNKHNTTKGNHKIAIYDRLGNLVFTDDSQEFNADFDGWDGTFRGNYVLPGVYIMTVDLTDYFGKRQILKQDLTVIR